MPPTSNVVEAKKGACGPASAVENDVPDTASPGNTTEIPVPISRRVHSEHGNAEVGEVPPPVQATTRGSEQIVAKAQMAVLRGRASTFLTLITNTLWANRHKCK
jgi:hypothetical protein